MGKYKIADLEQLSGIRAHTIRIWEKRYKLIRPHRTETNIRLYDDEQLKRLLQVTTLLSMGHKISEVAAMSDKEIRQAIEEQHASRESEEDVLAASMVNALLPPMLSFDEEGFEKVLSSAITRFGLLNATLKVTYPFLRKTGMLWSISDVLPVQEHFASSIIRRKLMAAIDGITVTAGSRSRYLLFLPEGEHHEIGLLLSDYILRTQGKRTFYLGANVPAENVISAARLSKATHLLSVLTVRFAEEGHTRLFQSLHSKLKLPMLIAGEPSLLDEIRLPAGTTRLISPETLLMKDN